MVRPCRGRFCGWRITPTGFIPFLNRMSAWEEYELDNTAGNMTQVHNTIRELTVREMIGEEGFGGFCAENKDVSSVVILDGVTGINNDKCAGHTALASVTAIRNSVFSGCKKLASVTIPCSVRLIGESAFAGCLRLRSVDTIPGNPFHGCESLESIDASENPNFVFVDGVLFSSDMTHIVF